MRMDKVLATVVLIGVMITGTALGQASKPAPSAGPGPTSESLVECPGMGGMGMGGMGMGGMGMGGGLGSLSALKLTEQQRTQVNKIIDDHQKTQYELMGKGVDLRSKLRDLYAQDRWDATAIIGVQSQMAKLHEQMVRSRIDAHNGIRDALTPDQRRQYREWGGPVPENR